MKKLEEMKAKKANMAASNTARFERDKYRRYADADGRSIGSHLGAILADDRPLTAEDLILILKLTKSMRKWSRSEGFHAHVARTLDCEEAEATS